jgi:Phosphodiester glycosidase
VDPSPNASAPPRPAPNEAARAARRAVRELATRRRRRRRRRLVVLSILLVVLSPALYSYVSTMLMPSSLPLGVRSVEWLRSHHGNWLVDEVESVYYGWKTPAKGGPQLTSLPSVGVARPASNAAAESRPASRTRKRAHVRAAAWPPRVKPVFPHPLPGEGVWVRSGPLVDGGPAVLLTTFRTELDYPRIVAYVAWFDHTRTALALYPGRYEPPSAVVRGPMSVPQDQRWRLLATFNGGFTYIDGGNGSAVNGQTNEPLKDGLATLVGYRDGKVNIVDWKGGPDVRPNVVFARQSLPPIIWNGKLNPALNDSSQWGATLGNAVRVWRTGVGIDRRGNVIYAAADYQTVITLAQILRRAGAVRAMQFDINPEWPTLIAYGHDGGLVPAKIVPNVMQPATRYLVPDDRDFFAVYRRLPGPVTVPRK